MTSISIYFRLHTLKARNTRAYENFMGKIHIHIFRHRIHFLAKNHIIRPRIPRESKKMGHGNIIHRH